MGGNLLYMSQMYMATALTIQACSIGCIYEGNSRLGYMNCFNFYLIGKEKACIFQEEGI